MAYKVKLEIFEGLLDLLLHLIKEEQLDIYDIPITRITEQYLEYLNLMEMMDLEIAGEFLVMAATLMQIKSRMLLPPDPEGVETEEADPRAELIRRLLAYKAFKEAAQKLKGFEEERGLVFTRPGMEALDGEPAAVWSDGPMVNVSLFDLLSAFTKILKGLPKDTFHEVVRDEFTVAEKIEDIVRRLSMERAIRFRQLFRAAKNKMEAITIFLALLELIRLKQVNVAQAGHFEDIEITRPSA